MNFLRHIFLLVALLTFSCDDYAQIIRDESGLVAVVDPASTAISSVNALFTGGNAYVGNEQAAMENLVRELVISGNWDAIFTIQLGRRLSSEAKCMIDLKGLVNGTGSGVWDIATGVQTNGSSTYWLTNFIQSTHAPNSMNNIGYMVELMSNDHGGAAGDIIGGVGTASNKQFRLAQNGTGGITWKIGTASTSTVVGGSPFTTQWQTIFRSNSGRAGLEREMDGYVLSTAVSIDILNRAATIGAFNNNGTIQSFFAGKFGGFVAFDYNKFDAAAFYVAINNFYQALGDTKDTLYPYDLTVKNYTSNDVLAFQKNGQSNESGRAESASTYLTLPYQSRVKVAWRNPAVVLTPMSIQTLQRGVNHNIENLLENGSELAACYYLAKYSMANILLLKHAIQGTSIIAGPGDDWNVSSGELANVGVNLIARDGLAAYVTGGKVLKKVFFHWNQGEANVNGTTQADYQTALADLIKYEIDMLLTAGYNLTTTTEFHVLIRRMSPTLVGSTTADIIAAQNNIQAYFNATYPAYTSYVTSWTIYNTDELQLYDGVHLTARAQEILGIRLGMYLSRK